MKMKWMVAVAAASVVMVVAAGCGGGSNAAAPAPAAAASSSQAQGSQSSQGNNPQGSTGAGQGQQGAPGGGRQFNPNNFAAGQVSSINGSTIELTTNNGALTVKTSDQTQVQKQVAASLSDIQAGERIVAQGTREADGSFTAQTVQLAGQRNPNGGTPGPRGGNGGGAGPNGQAGGQGGQNGARQFNPNNFTAGQVSKVNGSDIELTAANGVTVTVHTSGQTKFEKAGQGSLSDITSGERITVRGTRAADGTFTAQMIQVGGGFPGGGTPAQAPAQNSNGNQ